MAASKAVSKAVSMATTKMASMAVIAAQGCMNLADSRVEVSTSCIRDCTKAELPWDSSLGGYSWD